MPLLQVIFKRKWVKGGQALVVPERAPARTISVAFDQREERLTRHAIALEQSIYLYLREADAREDLEMKLEGIRLQLEQALVSIGYDKAFSQGINIVPALQRGQALNAMRNATERALEADRMFVEMFCGVISKSEFPFKNLAASIARASLYTPTGKTREQPAVMLVPPGMIDLPRFTKKSEMYYDITGVKTTDGSNKVSLKMPNALEYPDANIRVLVHTPPAAYRTGGAAYPQVENNEMEGVIAHAAYYVESYPKNLTLAEFAAQYNGEGSMNCADVVITDFEHKEWKTLPRIRDAQDDGVLGGNQAVFTLKDGTAIKDQTTADKRCYRWYLRAQMATTNNSALLCTRPGSETGELLYAYPAAHVSTSQHTGSLILTLTTYYGCAIRHPERLLVLNGIQFNGIVGGHTSAITPVGETYNEDKHSLLMFTTETPPWETVDLWQDEGFKAQAKAYELYPDEFFGGTMDEKIQRTNDVPVMFYRGTTRLDGGLKARRSNNGHLGVLDHPRNVGCIQGYQVFRELATPDDSA